MICLYIHQKLLGDNVMEDGMCWACRRAGTTWEQRHVRGSNIKMNPTERGWRCRLD